MKNKAKYTYLDYRAIREESHRMDCTITEADFNTNRPNPYRIDYIVGDIHRCLVYRGGEMI